MWRSGGEPGAASGLLFAIPAGKAMVSWRDGERSAGIEDRCGAGGPLVKEAIAEGDVLVGKYRVERIIGRGGMGVVLSAMHLQLNQRVAIKLLLVEATADMVARFLREARSSVRLKSEHVARVLDVGELPSGAPFMVMEYLEGSDLSGVIRSGGARTVEEAVEYVLHACEGIAEAHTLGIVHRDLKPANLFLTKAADGSDTIKVLDFGISTAATGDDADTGMALTKTTSILGSPLYMAPEQMKSARDADARSDIWSLGAILYELLAANPPFNTTTFTELVLMVNMQNPPPLGPIRADVPPGLEAAILRCLAKSPADRFENVAELAWAIAEFGPPRAMDSAERVARMVTPNSAGAAGQRKSALSDPSRSATGRGSITALASSAVLQPPAASGGKGLLIGGVVAALGVVGVVAYLATSRGPVAMGAPPPNARTADPAIIGAAPDSLAAPGASPSASAAVTVTAGATAPASPSVSAAPTASAAPAPQTPGPRAAIKVAAPPPPVATAAATKKNPLDIRIKD